MSKGPPFGHTPSIAFRHLPPKLKEGCRETVLGGGGFWYVCERLAERYNTITIPLMDGMLQVVRQKRSWWPNRGGGGHGDDTSGRIQSGWEGCGRDRGT